VYDDNLNAHHPATCCWCCPAAFYEPCDEDHAGTDCRCDLHQAVTCAFAEHDLGPLTIEDTIATLQAQQAALDRDTAADSGARIHVLLALLDRIPNSCRPLFDKLWRQACGLPTGGTE